jgi:hypothetical protein
MAASHICIAVLTACVLLMLLKNLVQTPAASTYILDQLHRSVLVRILDRASWVLSAGTRLVGSKSGDITTSFGLVHLEPSHSRPSTDSSAHLTPSQVSAFGICSALSTCELCNTPLDLIVDSPTSVHTLVISCRHLPGSFQPESISCVSISMSGNQPNPNQRQLYDP